jgi:hypothetical protein
MMIQLIGRETRNENQLQNNQQPPPNSTRQHQTDEKQRKSVTVTNKNLEK